jgi:hypothetical protein
MQPDAKVEKKCATSYLMEDMILKSILPFLPIISDRDEVKGHVFSENLLFLNDSKNLFHI